MNNLILLFRSIDISGKLVIVAILLVLIGAFAANLIIHIQYRRLSAQINNRQNRRNAVFKNEMLNKIVQDYKIAGEINSNNVNTQAIIEKNIADNLKASALGESFVHKSMSIMIILGLLGTFVGLTISVSELVNVLLQDIGAASLDWNEVLLRLAGAAKGMGAAFSTSLVGIVGSIILNVTLIVLDCEEKKRSLMIDIEEYLDNNIAVLIAKDKESEYLMMNRILKDTFVDFGEKIEHTLKGTVNAFADSITNMVMDVSVSSAALDTTVERFDSAVASLTSAMADMSDFNTNLKDNVDRMDLSFIKMSESLSDSSNIIMKNYEAIGDLSTDLSLTADTIAKANNESLAGIEKLTQEIDKTVLSLSSLSESFKQSSDLSNQSLADMQQMIKQATESATSDISTLTDKIRLSFEQSLADNNKVLNEATSRIMDKTINHVQSLTNSFSDNQKVLAQTIAALPEQTMAFNKAASNKIQKQLDNIENSLKE